MVLWIMLDRSPFLLFNFYNDVDKAGLRHLMGSTGFDVMIPSILASDFNTHTLLWSLPRATLSGGHEHFTTWLDDEGWSLANPPLIPTWHGTGRHSSHALSVLDLVFLNDATLLSDVVSPVSISFQT